MERFAFIVHPQREHDFYNGFLGKITPRFIQGQLIKRTQPYSAGEIVFHGQRGNDIRGDLIVCPLTAKQIFGLPERFVLEKLLKAIGLAETLGAILVGLGGFPLAMSRKLAFKQEGILVASGECCSVFSAIGGVMDASRLAGISFEAGKILVVGAASEKGIVFSRVLARKAKSLTLADNDEIQLFRLANQILYDTGQVCRVSRDTKKDIQTADIVLVVTDGPEHLLETKDLKAGSILCDLSEEKRLAQGASYSRKDLYIIEGGIIRIPGISVSDFSMGISEKWISDSLAETILLALERSNRQIKDRTPSEGQVHLIEKLAGKHGWRVVGAYS